MENEQTHTNSDTFKLERQLCFSIYTFSRKIAKYYRPYLDELHITYPQYLVVLVLGEHGTSAVKDLGDKLFLDSGTLTPLLKRLQEAGYVSRTRSEEDERKVMVSLTDEGHVLKQKLLDIHHNLAAKICVPMEEYIQTLTEFQKLVTQMEQIWRDTDL